LHRADLAGQGRLSAQEFERAIASFNLFPSKVELQTLTKGFGNGDSIEIDRFLGSLRGTLNSRRLNIVKIAFEAADQDGDGVLSLSEIQERYDVTFN